MMIRKLTFQCSAFIFATLFLFGGRALHGQATKGVESSGVESSAVDSVSDESPSDDIRQAPVPLRSNVRGVGKRIADVSFTDIKGQKYQLSSFKNKKGLVILMTGTGCPLCQKFAPTLVELEKEYAKKGFAFLFLNPTESETMDEIREQLRANPFQGPYVHDKDENLLHALDVKTTTEAFVLDSALTLVYRGAVDDQYGLGYVREKPTKTYLSDALNSILAGKSPSIQVTTAPGCELLFDNQPPKATPITYHNRISRIVQNNCLDCHRDQGPAPFSLASFEEVKDYAGMIQNVVKRGVMPPWFAEPENPTGKSSNKHERYWANDRSLSKQDQEDLLAWIKSGAPEGDSADAPLKRKFDDDWTIGKLDDQFEFQRAVSVKANGIMPYKNVTVKTNLKEDNWVRAIEVIPGEPEVVHHILVFVFTPEEYYSRNRRERDAINYWGIYVPGNRATIYPDGYARKIPKDAILQFQVHYTPNGTATKDKTKIGFVYADKEPKHEVRTANITNTRFVIPANADNKKVEASVSVLRDVEVLGFLPHHHLRGKASRYDLISADKDKKSPEKLLSVPRYDFNWQLFYEYAEPRRFTKGDTIRFTAWYDNSKKNPANPDPDVSVGWGEQTYDEMHVGYMEYVVPGVKPGEPVEAFRRDRTPGASRDDIVKTYFNRFDGNKDGWLTEAELKETWPQRASSIGAIIKQLDTDKNEKLDIKEFGKLLERRR